jgi:large conductance mechanosensitive channel
MSFLQDFKSFAMKGNFVDLAIGVILGASAGKVVSALVDKVIMPPIGLLLGRVNFADLRLVLQHASVDANGKPLPEVSVGYGAAIQAFIDFLIVSFVVFLIVRAYGRFRAPETAAAPPPKQEVLLTEIRDVLKAQSTPPPPPLQPAPL